MFAVDGFWITSCSAKPQVSPNAPGSRSEPSKRNVFAAASCAASLRARTFGYALPFTFLFGELTAPVETQIRPAAGVEMYFRNFLTLSLSLNAAAKSAAPTTGLSWLLTIVGHGNEL